VNDTPKVHIRGISKAFTSVGQADVAALSEIWLNVGDGEFVSIVGPSGCGKSTLLNVIAGFEPPSTGEVWLDGKAIRGPGPERGVVFQEYGLFPWFTVAGNIAFGPRSRGWPAGKVESLVERYVELVGLRGFSDKYPHELSGGMRQRCALARCLANDPEVMLMDEPLARLDAFTRIALQEELLRIWGEASRERPKTVIYVTHSIEESVFLSDRVVVFSQRPGRILAEVKVPFPRPRSSEIRTDARFHSLTDEIWMVLRKEREAASPQTN